MSRDSVQARRTTRGRRRAARCTGSAANEVPLRRRRSRHLRSIGGSVEPTPPQLPGYDRAMAVITETLQVSGIRCERCVDRLAAALGGHDGLEGANANLMGVVT